MPAAYRWHEVAGHPPDDRDARVDAFRFVFMADCQLGCYAAFSGIPPDAVEAYGRRGMRVESVPAVTGFAWDAARYDEAIALVNELGADFAVMGGDMVDDSTDDAQYAELIRLTAALEVPMHWVPGNHDVCVDAVTPTPASLLAYRERFGPDHYTIRHAGATLVVVNTSVWTRPEGLDGEWERQRAALRVSLEEARRAGGPTLVLGHHPPFRVDPDEPDDMWNIPRVRRFELLDLLVDHGVATYLCGHWHRNAVLHHRGVEMVVSGPVGFPLADDPSGVRLVEVSDQGVRHRYLPTTRRG